MKKLSKIQNLDEAFKIIENRTNLEKGLTPGNPNRIYKLDRMYALCDEFNNPQDKLRIIHIAGSKGKGSTAAYLAGLLHRAGRKVGVYASPHLIDYRERFQITESKSFPEELAFEVISEILERLMQIDSQLPGAGGATTFEILTLMAFMLFSRCRCDTAIIETGLGGRLDATNIVRHPEAVLITHIEKEHTEILGKTITRIAGEKAGILKSGSPAWFSHQHNILANMTLMYHAFRLGVHYYTWRDYVRCIKAAPAQDGFFSWRVDWCDGSNEVMNLAMPGRGQAENAAMALNVARNIEKGFQPEPATALSHITLPGRFQILRRNPTIVIDGAHTIHSTRQLVKEFRKLPGGSIGARPILLFGCMEDKKVSAMGRILSRPAGRGFGDMLFSGFDSPRAAGIEQVASHFRCRNGKIMLFTDPEKALMQALESSGRQNRTILVTGSFHLAGEITQKYKKWHEKINRQGAGRIVIEKMQDSAVCK